MAEAVIPFLAGVIGVSGVGAGMKTVKIDGKDVEVSQAGEILGVAHNETSKSINDGLDSHHCPAKNCYKRESISSANGPAIKQIQILSTIGGQTDLQAAANTLAPYAAQAIGEQWGHGEDKNTAAQLAAHAILGATLAYINDGDLASGGSAAVASEAAADYLANQYNDGKIAINPLTGEFNVNLLPEAVKTQMKFWDYRHKAMLISLAYLK